MKKIVVIINHLGVGGAEHHVVDRINEMYQRGIQVYLITLAPEPTRSFKDKLLIPHSQWVMARVSSPWNIKQIFDLVKTLKSISPDVVATHSWYANTVGRLASFFARIPRVITAEHNVNIEKTWKQKLADIVLQFVSDKIVADSYTVKKSLVASGIQKSRIEVIYVSINFTEFFISSHTDVRLKYNIPKDTFVFLFAGSLGYQKNVFNIVKAFAKTKRGFLVIAGDGKDRKELEELVRTLGITDKVSFIGVIFDLADLMKASDAFIFTTRWEGLGLVVAEAILSFLPPIISKNTACGEMVTDGFNGLAINDPENSDEISSAMRRMSDDTALREKLRSNCGKLPFNLTIEHNIDEFLKLVTD